MILGPTVDQLSQPTAIGVKVDAVRGRQVLAIDIPVSNVVLDGTRDRVVPHQLQFDAPLDFLPTSPYDPLANFGQRVHLWSVLEIGGVPYQIERGWFQIEEWEEQDDRVAVTALDLTRCLETDEMAFPSSPPGGATLRSELQRLAGGLPVKLDTTNRGVPGNAQWGRNRVEAIHDLCETMGLQYAIKPDGYLHVEDLHSGRDPVAVYSAKDLLLDAPRRSRERSPNRITAVGEKEVETGDDKKKKESIKYSFTASATLPPYDGAYGTVRKVIEVASATSQAMVVNAANRAFSESMIATEARSLEIVLDPRIELGDIVTLIPEEEKPFVARVAAFSMPLDDPEGQMRVDVEVLAW